MTEKLLEANKPNYGFDAALGEYVDMIEKGVWSFMGIIVIATG